MIRHWMLSQHYTGPVNNPIHSPTLNIRPIREFAPAGPQTGTARDALRELVESQCATLEAQRAAEQIAIQRDT